MAKNESLLEAITATTKKANTQALDISFNELLDMVRAEELNITPDYQRLFRWSEGQRSRFIESLILEMPVPPIFVIEEEGGKYQLIDGLQRISSYLHLRGELDARHLANPVQRGDRLRLTDCDIIKQLEGLAFEDLPASMQIRLKRAFIRVEVVRAGTDPHFKYHMFKRLNTGGDGLSEQQIRNCAIRMLSSEFADFLKELAGIEPFKTCTVALTEDRMLSAFDEELVLRFFALRNDRDRFRHEVSDWLTDYMEGIADPDGRVEFDYGAERSAFEKTFLLLAAALGEKAFAFKNKAGTGLSAGFSIYHYEALTMGLQPVMGRLDPANETQMVSLRDALTAAKLDPEFVRMTSGGGKNSPGPLRARIRFAEERLQNAFP
jgi:Protein of unknown function DUF262